MVISRYYSIYLSFCKVLSHSLRNISVFPRFFVGYARNPLTIPGFLCQISFPIVDAGEFCVYNESKFDVNGGGFVKTTVKPMPFSQVQALPLPPHRNPKKPGLGMRALVYGLSGLALTGTGFHCDRNDLGEIPSDQPCLIYMNHSCFLDLSIASRLLHPRPYAIVCTNDGFVGMLGGMEKLMRAIGCIPTRKFVTDLQLVRDIEYCLKTLKISVLMYPEASYSFDGTATPLPRKMGVLLKKLGVPLLMISTQGAFSRNPLYNELKVRKSVPVSAELRCLFTPQQIREKTVGELSEGIDAAFTFDHFRWQREQGLIIPDKTRADGLHRILYKCPHCGAEGKTQGRGEHLTCTGCGKGWLLTPLGELEALEGPTEFSHIPDWYAWEREQVRAELLRGTYRWEADVCIRVLRDYKAIYEVGSGHLTHSPEGFTLTGCEGTLRYTQKPTASYGLYADYYWYEIGDMVCIGDQEFLYYCFPQSPTPVAKPRLAAEELYKLWKNRRKSQQQTLRP